MGAILKGRDVDLGRDLAIKVLLEKHRDQPEMVRRFVEEAQIGGQLQHPGIVPVHELGQFPDGRLFIAMKLVKGRTLAALLETRKDPAEDRPRFLAIFEQVCQTMAYAHARGVIHRDLKPSNVMVGSFGEVQVMDWGLAKVLDQGGVADEGRSQRGRDESGTIRTMRARARPPPSRWPARCWGRPPTCPPSRPEGRMETLDERADVFGLGSILCEILTGEPAYTGASSVELYRKAERADLSGAIERLEACGADDELVALARSCLAAAPKDRPRDAGVVAAGLAALPRGGGAAAAVGRPGAGEGRGPRRRGAEAADPGRRAGRDRSGRGDFGRGGLGVDLARPRHPGGGDRRRGQPCDDRGRSASGRRRGPWLSARHPPAGSRRSRPPAVPRRWRPAAREIPISCPGPAPPWRRSSASATRPAPPRRTAGWSSASSRSTTTWACTWTPIGRRPSMPTPSATTGLTSRSSGPARPARELAASPVAVELAGALDQWIFIRRRAIPPAPPGRNSPEDDGVRQLLAVAKAADPDPWRNRLRDALGRRSKQAPATRDTLRQLAAEADPENLPEASVTRLAFALSSVEDVETAVSLLARAERVHPDDFWLNADLARLMIRTGRLEEAIRYYSVAVAIRPRSGIARNGLADALHRIGRLDDAAATLRRAVQLRPDDVWVHVGLGSVLLELGSPEDAQAQFREAESIRPGDAWIRVQIARRSRPAESWATRSIAWPSPSATIPATR